MEKISKLNLIITCLTFKYRTYASLWGFRSILNNVEELVKNYINTNIYMHLIVHNQLQQPSVFWISSAAAQYDISLLKTSKQESYTTRK